jgi:A/G-specific adenine glycosylase
MDLGATVCAPRNPACGKCPWAGYCWARKSGIQEQIPVTIKPVKKIKNGKVYLITNGAGDVFIRKRPGKGLLSGLYELPWFEGDERPFKGKAAGTDIVIVHVFSHFKLLLNVCKIKKNNVPMDGLFVPVSDLDKYPTSTLMKKVFRALFK